jgi:hypothetical protein
LAWVVAHHVEANDFGDAVVVKVADQRVDAAIDIVFRRPVFADVPLEALERNVAVAFNDVVGEGRLRQGRISMRTPRRSWKAETGSSSAVRIWSRR